MDKDADDGNNTFRIGPVFKTETREDVNNGRKRKVYVHMEYMGVLYFYQGENGNGTGFVLKDNINGMEKLLGSKEQLRRYLEEQGCEIFIEDRVAAERYLLS